MDSMVHLVLTLDYEIFGNGAGDVRRDMIAPTDAVLDVCERYGAKLTIMFETAEYWAFEGNREALTADLGYDPAHEMKEQAANAIERGHDVQLHIHPQWVDARYSEGRWRFVIDSWRLADLPHGFGDEADIYSITGALRRGKDTIETIAHRAKPDYACRVFRAGGLLAQPSATIISAMKAVGLVADSSVVRGYRADVPFAVDYSEISAQKDCWWTTSQSLTTEGRPGEGVMEFPISSQYQPYWMSLKPSKLVTTLKRKYTQRKTPPATGASESRLSVPSAKTVLHRMLTSHPSCFDFCKLSCRDMCRRVERSLSHGGDTVCVLIGHSKDFFNPVPLDHFLRTMSARSDVRFETFADVVHRAATSTIGST